jgi:hypothetical protein
MNLESFFNFRPSIIYLLPPERPNDSSYVHIVFFKGFLLLSRYRMTPSEHIKLGGARTTDPTNIQNVP